MANTRSYACSPYSLYRPCGCCANEDHDERDDCGGATAIANRHQKPNQAHGQAVNGQGIEQDMNVFRLTQISQNSLEHLDFSDQPLVGSASSRRAPWLA